MKKLILMVPFLLAGCATVDTSPVTVYSETITTTHLGFRKVFNSNYTMVKGAYANEYVKDPKNKFYNLVLVNDGGFYDFAANSGSILRTIKREQQLLEYMNMTMISYARILQQLANCDANALVAANDLNKEMQTMLGSLKELRVNTKFDVFSGAFIAGMNLYIENQRIELFRDAVTNNQANIEQYSEVCITLLHMMRDDIFRYYSGIAEPARDQFEKSNQMVRAGGVLQMIELNDRIENCLAIMKRMEEMYKILPAAHLEMANATKLPPIIEFIWGPKINDLSNINRLNVYKNSLKLSIQ